MQVRVLLARHRADHVPFDEAWVKTVGRRVRRGDGTLDLTGGAVRWPHDTQHRKEWKLVFSTKRQREAWRACYEGWPVERRELPLMRLELVA